MIAATRARPVLPGFGFTLGATLAWLGLLVVVPLGAMVLAAIAGGWEQMLATVLEPRVLAAFRVSVLTALGAALFCAPVGLLLAWVLVRYRFPGHRLVDAAIDLPFALPTAVAGSVLAALYAPNGWIGAWLVPYGIHMAYTPLGIFIALVFISLPFAVRTVQPVLDDLEHEQEEAAGTLGAAPWQVFLRVVLPAVAPAMLTGFAMAFARGLGEYGSVIFIAGNRPMVSEIVPLLIVIQLEQFNYAGAAVIGTLMLVLAFGLLFVINRLQQWMRVSHGG